MVGWMEIAWSWGLEWEIDGCAGLCVCTHAHSYMCTCVHTHTYVRLFVCTRVSVHVLMYSCVRACVCAHPHVSPRSLSMSVCMCVCTRAPVYECPCVFVWGVHVCLHTCA